MAIQTNLVLWNTIPKVDLVESSVPSRILDVDQLVLVPPVGMGREVS